MGLTMKTLMFLVGVIAIAAGLLWAGQGAGYVTWPSDSFMINDVRWLYYGLITAIGGFGLLLMARRRA